MSKISELSDGGSLTSTDYLIAVRSGGNVKVRMDQINVDQVDLGDNEFIRLGNSQDLTMVHTSTQSIINQAGIGDLLIQKAGTTKASITANGLEFPDNSKAIFGAGSDLQIYHDGSDSYIKEDGTGNLIIAADDFRVTNVAVSEVMIAADTDGSVSLYHNGSAKLATSASGISVTGSVTADGLTVDGNAGIGTGSPTDYGATANTLEVKGASGSGIGALQLQGADSVVKALLYAGGSTEFVINTQSNHNMGFNTNNTRAMTIDTSGRVGIGVVPSTIWSSSYDALQIGLGGSVYAHGGAGSNMQMAANSVYEGTAPNYYDKYLTSSTASKYVQDSGLHIWSTAASGTAGNAITWSESMRIDTSGNVGIGTSSPEVTAHVSNAVAAGSDNLALRIQNPTNASDARIGIGFHVNAVTGSGWDGAYIQSANTGSDSGDLRFGSVTNNTLTEAMRIDASGNLLVGQTTASSNTVGTSLRSDGRNFYCADGNYSAHFNRKTSYGAIVHFAKDDTICGNIGVYDSDQSGGGGELVVASGNTGLKFDDQTNYIRPSNAAGALRDNIIDLGEPDSRFKDLYLSGGMQLSRAVTSETEIESYNNTDSGGAKYKISFKQNGTQVGVIEVGTSSTAYLTSSDYRLKENVSPLTSATERLKQLNPSRFNFIADADKTVDGFLAHEVQDVVPEAISGTKDAMRDEEYEVTPAVLDDDGNVVTAAVMGTRSVPDYQGIDQSKLVPLLVATIQELEARIAALES